MRESFKQGNTLFQLLQLVSSSSYNVIIIISTEVFLQPSAPNYVAPLDSLTTQTYAFIRVVTVAAGARARSGGGARAQPLNLDDRRSFIFTSHPDLSEALYSGSQVY